MKNLKIVEGATLALPHHDTDADKLYYELVDGEHAVLAVLRADTARMFAGEATFGFERVDGVVRVGLRFAIGGRPLQLMQRFSWHEPVIIGLGRGDVPATDEASVKLALVDGVCIRRVDEARFPTAFATAFHDALREHSAMALTWTPYNGPTIDTTSNEAWSRLAKCRLQRTNEVNRG